MSLVEELFDAVKNENIAKVKELLNNGADVNEVNKNETVIFAAAETGNLVIINLLVEKRADISAMTGEGFSVLHCASGKGKKEAAAYFINKGLDINIRSKPGSTPLMNAASEYRDGVFFCHNEVVKFLIDKGADVNIKSNNGFTALMQALGTGNCTLEILELFLKKGADIHVKYLHNGDSLLHRAVEQGNKKIVELLIKKGLDINAKSLDRSTPIHKAFHFDSIDMEMIELLIKKGADINIQKNNGESILDRAFSFMYKNKIPILSMLITKGAAITDQNFDSLKSLIFTAGEEKVQLEKILKSARDIGVLIKKISNTEWGFTFCYPGDWEIFWKDEKAGSWIIPYTVSGKFKDGSKVIFMINAIKTELLEGGNSLAVYHSFADGTHRKSPSTPLEYIEMMKGVLPKDFDNYKYLSSGVAELDGIPAANISYNYSQSGATVYEEMLTVFPKGKTFQLVCSMPKNKRKEYMKLCNDILKNFIINK